MVFGRNNHLKQGKIDLFDQESIPREGLSNAGDGAFLGLFRNSTFIYSSEKVVVEIDKLAPPLQSIV